MASNSVLPYFTKMPVIIRITNAQGVWSSLWIERESASSRDVQNMRPFLPFLLDPERFFSFILRDSINQPLWSV